MSTDQLGDSAGLKPAQCKTQKSIEKGGNSPGALWSEIWLVSFERIIRIPLEKERLTHRLKRDILLKASVNLLVSLSTCGADKFDAPKLLSNKAKKRFNT
jgi:hypothetical protein